MTVSGVKCETKMKSIELKEICVDIEVSLPREECDTEEREECRYEPREILVQRCDPTVAEVQDDHVVAAHGHTGGLPLEMLVR